MKRTTLFVVLVTIMAGSGQAAAEARREGGEDVLRKAQYMIRQLNQEKSELQKQVAELQQKFDALNKDQKASEASLEKSRRNNQRLVERVQSDADKYRILLDRYRETVLTLRQSNSDNQYLVRAVEEREQWIEECRDRNQGLFAANSDLLNRYRKAATRFDEPFTGIGTVTVENETQEYRFKLEDLQVTRFRPEVDVETHTRQKQEAARSDARRPSIN